MCSRYPHIQFFLLLWSSAWIHFFGTPRAISRSVTLLICFPCTMTSSEFGLPWTGDTTRWREAVSKNGTTTPG